MKNRKGVKLHDGIRISTELSGYQLTGLSELKICLNYFINHYSQSSHINKYQRALLLYIYSVPISLKHIPRHAHNCVQTTLLTAHLQGGLHVVLHLHVTNWGNVLEIIPLRIHVGFQIAPHLLHPQLVGSGASKFPNKDFPQICPLWYTARRTCCFNASLLGGR